MSDPAIEANAQENNETSKRDQVKEKDSLIKAIPLILSTLALALSLTSFYFQFMRESHSVKASVAKFDLDDWASIKTNAIVRGVIVNAGNKYEIVNLVKLAMGDKSKPNGAFLFFQKESGPFVLKPGEAVPFEVSGDIQWAFEGEGRLSGDKNTSTLDVAVVFVSVTPGGQEKSYTHWIGTLMYYQPSDNFKFQPISTSGSQWIELMR